MSASVPESPSALKSAPPEKHVGQQLPARHAKNASISASVPKSPSPLKSEVPQAGGGQPQRAMRDDGRPPACVNTPPTQSNPSGATCRLKPLSLIPVPRGDQAEP